MNLHSRQWCVHNVVLEEETVQWMRVPQHLEEELVRLFFRYLGIREKTPEE